jgi:hypothetical protein
MNTTSGGREESALRPLLEDFHAGRIDRRALVKKALAAGASAAAVYGAIGEAVAQIPPGGSEGVPVEASDPLNAKNLQKITAEMIDAISSAPFVQAMLQIKLTPKNKRLDLAPQLLMPDILRAKGVPLPKDMRITSRYFERGSPSVIEVNDYGAFLTSPANPLDAAAAGLGPLDINPAGAACGCACGGAATVCGGAGGGVGLVG